MELNAFVAYSAGGKTDTLEWFQINANFQSKLNRNTLLLDVAVAVAVAVDVAVAVAVAVVYA